ncbi:MAG: helix-turn-helix domain-containing protein [bacterium]
MNSEKSQFLSIGKAATYLGLTPTTLRRWNKAGTFRATFVSPGEHLYYSAADLEKKSKGLVQSAFDWTSADEPFMPPSDWHCLTSDVFKTRLEQLTRELLGSPLDQSAVYLIASAVGEIGNNSYDHNLGNWPDILGAFFSYDLGKKYIVLGDRGVGILATLKQIKPELSNHREALKVAFTEVLTGRAPEHRGNGLKYVLKALEQTPAQLEFQSGDACLRLLKNKSDLQVKLADVPIRGCFAVIHY